MPLTQAQIDAMKVTNAQMASQIDALVADGPPAGFLYTQFNAAYCGNVTHYTCGIDGNGNPTTPAGVSSIIDESTPTSGRIIWGSTAEHHKVITAASGEQWGACLGYEDMSLGNFYAQQTVQADWGPVGGPYRDISSIFAVAGTGGPSCPVVLPASGTWRIRMWMWILNNDGSRARPAYSEQHFTFGVLVNNKAWQGSAPQNRSAISYQEIWWDAAGGWTRGTSPTLPWSGSAPGWGSPQEIVPTFLGSDAYGLNEGVLWQYVYPDYQTALVKGL